MAQTSKRQKYHMQTKRENSQLKRALAQSQQAQGRATAIILGLLVQVGGDVTLSQATTDRMDRDMARLGYRMEPDPEGLVKVVLVVQEPEPGDVPAEVPSGNIVLTD